MNGSKQRPHPLTFVAFLLAIFVLLAPVQADFVFVALHRAHIVKALIAILLSLILVILPLTIAETQTRRHPERWKPRLLAKFTWGIVTLNVALNAAVFTNLAIKTNAEANHTAVGSAHTLSAKKPEFNPNALVVSLFNSTNKDLREKALRMILRIIEHDSGIDRAEPPTDEEIAQYWKAYAEICNAILPHVHQKTTLFDTLVQEQGECRNLAVKLLGYLNPMTLPSPMPKPAVPPSLALDITLVRLRCYSTVLKSGDAKAAAVIFADTTFDPSGMENEIASYLDTRDDSMLDTAVQTLARIARPNLPEPILELLKQIAKDKNKWYSIREAAYLSLGHLNVQKANEFLLETVFDGNTGNVSEWKWAGKAVLANIGDVSAEAITKSYLKYNFGKIPWFESFAFVYGAQILERSGLQSLLEGDLASEDSHRWQRALLFVRHLPPKKAGEYLLRIVADETKPEDERCFALMMANDVRWEALDNCMIQLIQKKNRLSWYAIEALGKGLVTNAVPALLSYADKNTEGRSQYVVAEAFARIRDHRGVSAVIWIATNAGHNSNISVRRSALRALGRIADPAGLPVVIDALKDTDGLTVREAISVCGRIGDACAVEPLLPFLRDADRSLQENCVQALIRIGTPDAIRAVREALPVLNPNFKVIAEILLTRTNHLKKQVVNADSIAPVDALSVGVRRQKEAKSESR